MKPLISVVIPAYNEEKLIAECIKALQNQTFPEDKYEIIVVNNNSTDKTAQIAKNMGAVVFDYAKKQGFSETKQFGVEKARAKIIAFIDADTVAKKDWLENIYKLMQGNKYVLIGGGSLPSESNFISWFIFIILEFFANLNQLFGIHPIWGYNMAVLKDAFLKAGGFNMHMKTAEDWELSSRMQKQFGRESVLYTRKLKVRTSSRKLKKTDSFLNYLLFGFINYFSIFILKRSTVYGTPDTVR